MAPVPKIALLVETSSSHGRGLLRGIAQYARLYGPWSFFIEPGGGEGTLSRLKEWDVQGIIARIRTRRQARQILAAAVPTVDLDYVFLDLFPGSIRNDDSKTGRLAAEHLIRCGLRHFAYCGWSPADNMTTFWESARRESFVRTVREAGLTVEVYPWPRRRGEWTWTHEQEHLARWIKGLPKPTGLMASNDQRGRLVLEAARRAGRRIPQDLAVIGVDNDEVLCEMSTPPLSSVELDTRRVGYEAAELLHKLMSRKRVPDRPIVIEPMGVIERRSTDLLAMEDESVAAAVRFIRSQAHKPIQVSDVLKAVPVSRKTLEIRFQRVLGHTPHEEIQRVRFQRLKDLLVHTDGSLKKIALACGFTYAEHMHAAFRKKMGVTPGEYRARYRGR